jgi:hypothetical protein
MVSDDKKIDLDILLQIASLDTEEEVELGDVEAFILSHKIQKGLFTVYNWQIYYVYKNWSKNPLPRHEFLKEFNKKFKVKERKYTDRYFGRYYYRFNSRFEVPYSEKRRHKKTIQKKKKREKILTSESD